MAGTVETHIDFAPVPAGRSGERAAVAAHRVLHRRVVGEPRRTVGHDAIGILVITEGICHVAIQRLVPRLAMADAIYLPCRRHVYIIPCGSVVVLGIKCSRNLRGVAHPTKLPNTVKAEEERRSLHVVGTDSIFADKRDGQSVSRLTVHVRDTDIVPLLQSLAKN